MTQFLPFLTSWYPVSAGRGDPVVVPGLSGQTVVELVMGFFWSHGCRRIMMKFSVELRYGALRIPFVFSEKPDIFTIREPRSDVTKEQLAGKLREIIRLSDFDFSRPSVVVADKTRLCGYGTYLPVLLRTLEEAGADPGRLTVHIAYGTHHRQSDEECASVYGDVYHSYRFEHHDCSEERRFVRLGETRRGTPVLLLRDVVDASCLITFGAISHHYFAGYGGGRKLVFPGLGFRDAIYRNHGLFLDARGGTLSAGCRPGALDGNPLAEDLEEYETFRPADLAVHGILDSGGRVRDLLPGRGADHFRAACAIHGANCEVAHLPLYDVVFASCGGYPKDINFIQSHKAIHNASGFVRDGGRLVILAQCREGIGSGTFLPWFEMGGWCSAFDRLAKNYEGNGGTALSMMSKLERIQVCMVTVLDDAPANLIGIRKIDIQEALRMAEKPGGRVAVIPNAGLLVKVEKSREDDGKVRDAARE
jgi:lactate racemase